MPASAAETAGAGGCPPQSRAISSWWWGRGWRKTGWVISIRYSALSYLINNLHVPRNVAIMGVIAGSLALVVGALGFASAVGPHRAAAGLYFRRAVLGRLRLSLFPAGRRPAIRRLIVLAFMHRDGDRQRRHVRAAGGLFRRTVWAASALFRFRLRPRAGLHHRRRPRALDRRRCWWRWMAGAPWGVCHLCHRISLVTAFAVWCGPETYRNDIRQDDVQDR